MNSTGSRFVKFNSLALALFATLMLIPGGASAQDQKANRSDNQARVAAPISFTALPWPDPAMSSRMHLTGDLAIVAESEALPMHSRTSDDDLVLWDLSNPATPRVVQKFSGVVKWLQDERNFIYVLNGEGLWVVSKPAGRQPEQNESSNNY